MTFVQVLTDITQLTIDTENNISMELSYTRSKLAIRFIDKNITDYYIEEEFLGLVPLKSNFKPNTFFIEAFWIKFF